MNRIQSVERDARRASTRARAADFRSINVDLIYGLPQQNAAAFDAHARRRSSRCAPDRIALYCYAHLPQRFKPQRRIDAALTCRRRTRKLADAGAARSRGFERRRLPLHRHGPLRAAARIRPADRVSAQGRLAPQLPGLLARCATRDLLGLGRLRHRTGRATYSQNVKTWTSTMIALDRGTLPIMRGVELTADDLARRALIQCLMCHFEVPIESLEVAHLIDFPQVLRTRAGGSGALRAAGMLTLTAVCGLPSRRWVATSFAISAWCLTVTRDGRERARYSKVV